MRKKRPKITGIILISLIVFPFLSIASEDIKPVDISNGWTPLQIALWNPVQLFGEHRDVYGLRCNILYGKNRNISGLDFGMINSSFNTNGIQIGGIVNHTENMTGFQFSSILNTSQNLSGFQISMANIAQEVNGLQLALLGSTSTSGEMNGVQITSGLNSRQGYMRGLQLAGNPLLSCNSANDMAGVQISGGINMAHKFDGLQIGLVINGTNNLNGVQIGLVLNKVGMESNGVQIGWGNIAEQVKGVQVGLLSNKAKQVKGFQIGGINYCEKIHGIQIGVINILREGTLPIFPVINASF
jgi:hypothetical protein